VNVPSEFLLIPRLMVSLLPRSMWVVVFILEWLVAPAVIGGLCCDYTLSGDSVNR
jgi:hypothetical protein